jgi:hypothetical protein
MEPAMSQMGKRAGQQRRDRLIQERVHDPYQSRVKLREPTVCPQCAAVYQDGRWQWSEPPAPAYQELCPACHRSNDRYPAGTVTVSGSFVAAHKDEILGLARHQEQLEKGLHPMNRIMAIEEQAETILITTTDIHLPRRIGEALHRAYEGDLDFHYDEESYLIRVSWTRDA